MRFIDCLRTFEANYLAIFLMAIGMASEGSYTINEAINLQMKLLEDKNPEYIKIFNDIVNKLNEEIEV